MGTEETGVALDVPGMFALDARQSARCRVGQPARNPAAICARIEQVIDA